MNSKRRWTFPFENGEQIPGVQDRLSIRSKHPARLFQALVAADVDPAAAVHPVGLDFFSSTRQSHVRRHDREHAGLRDPLEQARRDGLYAAEVHAFRLLTPFGLTDDLLVACR